MAVCMGMGEMRKRVMVVRAWCMWVWEGGDGCVHGACGYGKVVDG